MNTVQKPQWNMMLVILFTATIAYGLATFLGENLHWYLYILLLGIGYFVHTMICILLTDDEQKASDNTHFQGKA